MDRAQQEISGASVALYSTQRRVCVCRHDTIALTSVSTWLLSEAEHLKPRRKAAARCSMMCSRSRKGGEHPHISFVFVVSPNSKKPTSVMVSNGRNRKNGSCISLGCFAHSIIFRCEIFIDLCLIARDGRNVFRCRFPHEPLDDRMACIRW